MAKTYRLTETQLKVVTERIKNTKLVMKENLSHNAPTPELDGLSPEAQQYYKANPEAFQEKKQNDVEKEKVQQEQGTPQQDPRILDMLKQLQELGVTPDQYAQLHNQSQTATPAPTAGSDVAQEPTAMSGQATQKPDVVPSTASTPQGPQPAPTGNVTNGAAPSKDSTEALKAKAAAIPPMAETTPGAQSNDEIPFEEIPSEPAPENSEVTATEDPSFMTIIRQAAGIYHSGAGPQQAHFFGFPPGMEVDSINGDLHISWTVDFQPFPDGSGLQAVQIIINNITGQLQPEYMDHEDNYHKTDLNFDAKKLGFKFQVDMNFGERHSLRPRTLDVDWKMKLITID